MRRLALALLATGCSFELPDATTSDAAMQGDLIVEAEAFTTNVTPFPIVNAWSLAVAPGGFRGTGLVKCGPHNGDLCANDGSLDDCAPHLIFDLTVIGTSERHVHVRGLATSSSDDSVWYGIDGVAATNAIDFTQDGAWHYHTGDQTFTLSPGVHTLTLWQRECGLSIDQIALTSSATPPQ